MSIRSKFKLLDSPVGFYDPLHESLRAWGLAEKHIAPVVDWFREAYAPWMRAEKHTDPATTDMDLLQELLQETAALTNPRKPDRISSPTLTGCPDADRILLGLKALRKHWDSLGWICIWRLFHHSPKPWPLWVQRFCEWTDIDWTVGIRSVDPRRIPWLEPSTFRFVVRELASENRLSMDDLVDSSVCLADLDKDHVRDDRPQTLDFWWHPDGGPPAAFFVPVREQFIRYLDGKAPLLSTNPHEAAVHGSAALAALERLAQFPRRQWSPKARLDPKDCGGFDFHGLEQTLQPWVEQLLPLAESHPDDDVVICRTLFAFALRAATPAFGGESKTFSPETKVRISIQAQSWLGRLRKWARTVPEGSSFAHAMGTAFEATAWLAHHDCRWAAIKPLLLLFSSFPVIVVGNDLRYWKEKRDENPPPVPWRRLPQLIAALLLEGVRRTPTPSEAQAPSEDLEWEALRRDFAEFALSRLKSAKGAANNGNTSTPSARETRPAWRIAWLRAAAALAVNPHGRGHHIVHHVAIADPDRDVRAEAAAVEPIIRRAEGLKGISPRRALMRAFGELRVAHLLSLGVENIDGPGAQSTLDTEYRRLPLIEDASEDPAESSVKPHHLNLLDPPPSS